MKDITLSLAQMRSVVGDVQGNFDRMKSIIESVQESTDLICFPEACLTGYEAGEPEQFCIDLENARISDVSRLSTECDTDIVFGFMERQGPNLHMTQAISDRYGRMHLYRKTHLGRKERKKFTSGDDIPVFNLSGTAIGVQLCWESHFPDISTKMRKEGADVILIPYASPRPPGERREIWMKHLPARAYDNSVFVGAVNAVGDNGKGVMFGGGAMAMDPKGNVIAEHFGGEDHAVTIRLSSSARSCLGSDDNMGKTDYFMYRRNDLY